MKENGTTSEQMAGSRVSKAGKGLLLTFSIIMVLFIGGRIFLSTSCAAGLVSDYLSGMFRQRVVVSGLALSGFTLSFNDIRIENPQGFPSGDLLEVRSLSFAPDLAQIFAGRRNLALLRVEGVKAELTKNSAGEWNYSGLVRILSAKKKKPSSEFFIRRLIIRNASLKIGTYSLEKLALTLKDFSARGLSDSKLLITGADEKGEPFRIAAEGRLGKAPDMRLTLEAPRISMKTFGFALKGNSFLHVEKGTVKLSLALEYHSGVAAAKGLAAFDGLGPVLRGRKPVLHGRIDFAGRYVAARDEADLESLSIVINDRIRFDASGTVRNVRGDKEFVAELSCNRIPLSELSMFLPPETAGNIAFNGTAECRNLRLAGSRARGITSGRGIILVRDGMAEKGGQPLFKGLSSDMVISRTAGGWSLDGTLSMNASAGKFPLENFYARFSSRFSDRFRPLSVEIPVLKAGLSGVPVIGMLEYSPKEREPYRGRLYMKNAGLSAINRFLGIKNTDFASGTADLSVWGSGRGLASFSGEMKVRLSALKGHLSGKDFGVKAGKIDASFRRSGTGLTATGRIGADGGVYSGRNFSGMFDWSLSGDKLTLSDGAISYGRAGLSFARLTGRLPVRELDRNGARYPLAFDVSGMDMTAGEAGARDVSGSVSSVFSPGSGTGRLRGSASLVLPSVSYRKQSLGAIKVHAVMSGEGTVAELGGIALGGPFSSKVKFDPFSPAKGVSFKGWLRDAQAVELSGLLPDRFKLTFPAGKINTDFDGNWSGNAGLRLGLESSGTGISVAVRGGKTALSGAGLVLKAEAAGADITINEATIGKGEAVVLKVSGKVAGVASPSRKGLLTFYLGSAPVNSLLDAFANILPKPLQEADGAGGIGAHGSLGFAGGKVLLEGNASFDNARLDIPSQKLSVSGVDGSLPFSLTLAGDKVVKPADDLDFSRENYASLLKALRQSAKGVVVMKIANIRFGALETSDVRLCLKAGEGRTEVTSIESSLYGGAVLGNGWFLYNNGPIYSADLILNGLSLRLFCNSYPALKGYISGLLDGVISIYGKKGGIPALVGFVDLWARRGKGEKMLVSKEFLQKMAGKKLKGFFFSNDRPYDNGEISAYLMDGYVTFEKLDISHTNFFGMKDLSVSVAPVQNMIGLDHMLQTIREAAARGKPSAGGAPPEPQAQPDIKWLE